MEEQQNRPYLPGDVVLTSFGVGVLASCPSGETEQFFRTRLWRAPGKSIGSSVVAYLRSDAIMSRLPAAPGMTTLRSGGEFDGQEVMVHCYYASKNLMLVTRSSDTAWQKEEGFELLEPIEHTEWIELSPDDLQDAPAAKFYPLLDELMRRGDVTASATSSFLNQKDVEGIVTRTTQMVESSASSPAISKDSVEELTASVLPDESQVKEVYTMLKDEELTVLLEKGKERLQQLVSTDIPHATEQALLKTGITVVSNDESESTITKSRETALAALEVLLKDGGVDEADMQAIRGQVEQEFTTMFDAMRDAAQSDETLNSIFDTISGKTSEWQEATGRLLSTKSASLFLEGANRLQARAANIFSQDQLQWAGDIGSRFTKAFTEGDAAVARLKSVELGDAVRSRLVTAIEVRSGTHGGLDGIIAGALSTIKSGGEESGDQFQQMLTTLQQTASSATKDAHETLISMLSQRSQYKDVALLRIEHVLCDLENQLGEEMSAEDIAGIARGEGGTSAIFEPIARRAAQEIEKQLDVAESSVSDATVLEVLSHVRKILSGDLTLSGVMDEVVSVLNDDSVVAAGATIVKHSENVLDAIEGVSGNKVVETTLEVAEKAGITKDAVMQQMQSLNVNEILDTAQGAVTDEKARRELLSSATDVALDFVLRILPSMPVPPFDGVKDGLVYHISNLSMKGFKVRKEDIVVEIAGMRATKKSKPAPRNTASVNDANGQPRLESGGETEASHVDASFCSNTSVDLSVHQEIPPGTVKATELLIIDVQGISAVLEDVVWSFEQTYMPYLKGSGKANVKLSDGAIRLQFELRRRPKRDVDPSNGDGNEWEPVLCLHDRSCSIDEVDLVMQGEGKLTWILNKLAAVFKGPLRDYVVRTIVGVLTNQSGNILEKLNEILTPYWGLVMRTAGLAMDDLVEADDAVITAAVPHENDNLVELVWRENLPLGMNLLLNDESGLLKVVDFPRGSQARAVCTERHVDPAVFDGSTIVAVNGRRFEDREDLFEALRDPGRPKAILFELANSQDAERIKQFVGGNDNAGEDSHDDIGEKDYSVRTVNFTENRELGIQFSTSRDNFALAVHGFHKSSDGIVFEGEKKQVPLGALLSHVNGELVLGANGSGKERALSLLETVGCDRPLALSFVKPYLCHTVFEKPSNVIANVGGPEEFVFKEEQYVDSKRIILKDFNEVAGMAEASGILIGDHLVFVNAVAVGAGCRLLGETNSPQLSDVYKMLREEESYPIGLTFARPMQQESRWATSAPTQFNVESAETICVTADSFEQLGCVFGSENVDDVVVTDLFAVKGPIQLAMHECLNMSIDAVNGHFVPSYATPSIVMNALKRSWTTNETIEVVFLDDARKDWVHKVT